MIELFKKHKTEKPPYLERMDELEKLTIVRLKGPLDQTTIPIVESRIQENRKHGSKIDKNVVIDFAKVVHVDSAMIAFHIIHLREFQEKGFQIAFINISAEMRVFMDMFKVKEDFRVFASEAEAVRELNK